MPRSGTHGGLSRSNGLCASCWLAMGECPPSPPVPAGARGPAQPQPRRRAGAAARARSRSGGRCRGRFACGTRGAALRGGGAFWRRHRKAEGAAGGGRGAGGGHGRPGLPAVQDHQVPQPLLEADGERLWAHAVSGAGLRGERARSGAPAAQRSAVRRGLGKGSLPPPGRGWRRHQLRQTERCLRGGSGPLVPPFPPREGPCQPGLGPVCVCLPRSEIPGGMGRNPRDTAELGTRSCPAGL